MRTRRQEPPGRGGDKPGRKSERPERGPGRPERRSGPQRQRRGDARGPGSAEPPRRPRDGERPPRAPGPPALARPGRELLYGRNAVLEALRGRRRVERLFLAEGMREDDRLRALTALATERNVEIDRVPRLMLDDATRGANHQGVVLEAEPFRDTPFEEIVETPGIIVVLDHLQDPQNVGTLLRAAEAAGVAGVVMAQDRAAEITPAVVNASAGAVEHLRVATVPNLAWAIEALKRSGRWVAGLDAGSGSQPIYTTEIPEPAALVIGAEGAGLGAHLRKQCDLLLALPMRGKVASLNAATAGAIALYELVRREQERTGSSPGDDGAAVGENAGAP